MTTIDGMPVSAELVKFLKEYCPTTPGAETFLTSSVEAVSDAQDFICAKLGEMNEKDKCEVATFLSSIVLLKNDLKQLAKLLPVIKMEE